MQALPRALLPRTRIEDLRALCELDIHEATMFLRAFDGQLPECVQVFILVGSGHLKPGPVCAGSFYGLLHPFQVGLDDEIACIISVSIHLVQSVKNLLSRVCLHALFYCCRGGMDL